MEFIGVAYRTALWDMALNNSKAIWNDDPIILKFWPVL